MKSKWKKSMKTLTTSETTKSPKVDEKKKNEEKTISARTLETISGEENAKEQRHPSLFYRRSSLTLHKKERMIFFNMRGTSIRSQARQICWRDTRRVLFSLK